MTRFVPGRTLRVLLARETVERIRIVLPEPGSPFFWQRRNDEISRERRLDKDPIARLARAIEMLYLTLPEGGTDPGEFFERQDIFPKLSNPAEFEAFAAAFEEEMKGHIETYMSIKSNREFTAEFRKTVNPTTTAPTSSEVKLRVMFATGSMMGVSMFDTRIIYVPYLPGVEDRDCPEFTVNTGTTLGASLERSLSAMESTAIGTKKRSHVLVMASRLWDTCKRRNAPLRELSDVPAWLSRDYGQ